MRQIMYAKPRVVFLMSDVSSQMDSVNDMLQS